jgi:hypothetical protein
MVRRNAALSLVRFKDEAGHDEIVGMLRRFALASPVAGTLEARLKAGDVVNPGTLVAHVQAPGQKGEVQRTEVRAVVPGTLARWIVSNGAAVSAGQPIAVFAPSESLVWEALRALYIIGRYDDLPDVEPYIRGTEGMSPQITQQALVTERAIRGRSPKEWGGLFGLSSSIRG